MNEQDITPEVPQQDPPSWNKVSSNVMQKGMEMLEEEPPVAVDVEPPVQAVDTPQAVEVELPQELNPETDGDRLVRVKIDGNWEVKPLKEVTASWSRQSHYTRQMQELAKDRQQVESERTKAQQLQQQFQQLQLERQQLAEVFKDRNKFLQLQNHLFGQQQAEQPQGDPNEIVTAAQMQKMLQQREQQFMQQLQQMQQQQEQLVQKSVEQQRFERDQAFYKTQLDPVFQQVLADNPILSKIPNIEDTLRYQVAQLQPKTPQEAKEAIGQIAQGIVEDIKDQFKDLNKQQVVAKAKLQKAQIEPPGGTGVQIQPTQAKDLLKGHGRGLDSNKLLKAGLAMLE